MLSAIFTARAINEGREANDAFEPVDFSEKGQLLFEVSWDHVATLCFWCMKPVLLYGLLSPFCPRVVIAVACSCGMHGIPRAGSALVRGIPVSHGSFFGTFFPQSFGVFQT